MTARLRLWLEIAHQENFRIGGWGLVRDLGGEVRGIAGGARRIDQEAACLMALAAALADAPAGADVVLHTSSAALLALLPRLAAPVASEPAAAENAAAWAGALAAVDRVRLSVLRADAAPGGPAVFAGAWAALALDRAKAKGPFTAPIPRSNLARAGV